MRHRPGALLSRSGFSILQVMVALSLSMVVLLAIMQLGGNTLRLQAGSAAKASFDESIAIARRLLTSEELCSCNFRGIKAPLVNTNIPVKIHHHGNNCAGVVKKILEAGLSLGQGAKIKSVRLTRITQIPNSTFFDGTVKVVAERSEALGARILQAELGVGLEASTVAGGTATLSGCTDTYAMGMPLYAGAGTVSGNTVNALKPATHYMVTVYGYTENRGNSMRLLEPISVMDCAGNILASTQGSDINWPDGNAPHSATLHIQAPGNGCIRGKVDGGVNNVTNMTYVAVGSPAFMSANGGVSKVIKNVAGNRLSGLVPNERYLVSVYGVTRDAGSGYRILQPVRLLECNKGPVIAATNSSQINWPDGNAPVHAQLVITAPASGCVEGYTDGDEPAWNMFYVKTI